MSWGSLRLLAKPCILLTQDVEDVPFDIRQYRLIQYDTQLTNSERTQAELVRSIMAALGEGRLDEAQRLIESGSVRAGVALLGVLLEQTLKYVLMTADLVDVRLRDSFPSRNDTYAGHTVPERTDI